MAESEPPLITNGGENDDDAEKKKSILIELSEEQYTELKATKKRHGFTWLGMLLHAQRCLYREERQ